jgi:hypothetical protein
VLLLEKKGEIRVMWKLCQTVARPSVKSAIASERRIFPMISPAKFGHPGLLAPAIRQGQCFGVAPAISGGSKRLRQEKVVDYDKDQGKKMRTA